MAPIDIFKRQGTCVNDGLTNEDECDDSNSWWWSGSGLAVRYVVVAALFGAVILFFLGAWYHARRRIRKGQEPLAYHRWLVGRPNYGRGGRHGVPATCAGPMGPQSEYGMQHMQGQSYAPPPPAYGWDAPPMYQPPEGGTKAMPNQNIYPRTPGVEGSSSGLAQPTATHAPEVRSP